MTSRRPDTLRLYDFYSYWRDTVGNYTTLPQHFKENGYFTHSIGKVFHPGVSSNFTDDAKYSWSDAPYHPSTEKYKESKVCNTRNGTRARNLMCPVIIEEQPEGTLPDIQSIDAALDFLNRRNNAINPQPYFLAVGLHKPHVPLKYPLEYLSNFECTIVCMINFHLYNFVEHHPLEAIEEPVYHYRPPGLPVVAWNPWTDVRQRDDIASLNISFPFGYMPSITNKKIIQSYNAATSYIDDLIGNLLNKITSNTIIIVVGDHGNI